MNPNPLPARLAKKVRRKPGDLPALLKKLWGAVLHAETVMETAEDADLRLKAVHALSQCAGQYAKLLEIGELEGRLAALEAQAAEAQPRR